MTTNSNDRRWRAGYRAAVQDAIGILYEFDRPGVTVDLAEVLLAIHGLFLVNPRGPDKGAAERYGLGKD